MIHILDHQTDEIVDFYSNKKKLFWNDIHFSSLENYEEYYNFTTLYDNSEFIAQRNRVIIPDEDGFFREFIIIETLKSGKEKEVYALASFVDDLNKAKTIKPQSFEGETVNSFLDKVLEGTGWKRGKTDYLGIRTVTIEDATYPFSVLKVGAKTFDGELNFRIETEGNKVIRYVDLVERQGAWNGKEITLGKDLIGVTRRETSDNIVTALICYGPEREDGTRLEVTVTDEDARKRWGRPANNPQHLWAIYEPQSVDEEMTEERLRSLGETELKKRVNSAVEYEADQASIEHIFGFDHEKVRKGDTVRIKDTSYTPALYLEARVKSVERSLSNPSQKKYILGDFIEYDEADLTALFRSMQKVLSQKISEQQLLEKTYDKATIDDKDNYIFDEGKTFAELVGEDSKAHADSVANQAKLEAISDAEQYADIKMGEAIEEAKAYAVAQDIYDAKMQEIAEDLAEKVDFEYVNGQLELKADSDTVQAIEDTVSDLGDTANNLQQLVDNHADELESHGGRITTVETDLDTVEGQLSVTINNLSDLEGIVSQQQIEINANASAIELKASQDDLDTVSGDVSSLSGELSVLAGEVALKASQSALENLEDDVTKVSNDLASLVVNVDGISSNVSSLTQTVDNQGSEISSLESSYTQLAGEIEQKVDSTTYQTDIDGIIQTLDHQSTLISQNASQIALKADDTRVDTLEGTVDDHSAQFTVMADQISSKVDATYVEGVVNDIEIGGRNLLRGTSDEWTTLEMGTSYFSQFVFPETFLEVGKTYTFSIIVEKVSDDDVPINLHLGTGTNSYQKDIRGWRQNRIPFGVRVSLTHTVTEEDLGEHEGIFAYRLRNEQEPTTIRYRMDILEHGNKATDWTPAPEDVQAEITVVEQYASSIDQKADSISATVSSLQTTVGEHGTQISQAQTDIQAIAGQVSTKAEASEVTALGTKVTTVEQNLSALEGVVETKVDDGEARSIFRQEADSFTFDASQINFQGHVFGEDATFSGRVEGAVIEGSQFISQGGSHSTNDWRELRIGSGHIIFEERDNNTVLTKFISFDIDGIRTDQPFKIDTPVLEIPSTLEVREKATIINSGGGLILQASVSGDSVYHEYRRHTGQRMGYVGYGSTTVDDLYINNEVAGGKIRVVANDAVVLSNRIVVEGSQQSNGLARFEFWNQGLGTRYGRIGYLDGTNRILGIQNYMNDDVRIYGDFSVSGKKSAVVETESYGTRKMYALETPDNRFVAYTEHVLEEGEHIIYIEKMFRETISDYFVAIHPQNCVEVRLQERLDDSFVVKIIGGTAEVVFEVVGKRIGHENVYMEKSA